MFFSEWFRSASSACPHSYPVPWAWMLGVQAYMTHLWPQIIMFRGLALCLEGAGVGCMDWRLCRCVEYIPLPSNSEHHVSGEYWPLAPVTPPFCTSPVTQAEGWDQREEDGEAGPLDGGHEAEVQQVHGCTLKTILQNSVNKWANLCDSAILGQKVVNMEFYEIYIHVYSVCLKKQTN